jgi:hypothetical protein
MPVGKLYSIDELPEFAEGTSGLIALPREDAEFACVVAPRSGRLYMAACNRGQDPKDKEPIDLSAGELHMLLTDAGRHGLALDASLGNKGTYEITQHELDPHTDARAAILRAMWAQLGCTPDVIAVRRVAPVNVLGQLPEGSPAAGRRFGSPRSSYDTLVPRCFVVFGQDSIATIVREDDMARMFHALALPGGEIVRELATA